MEKNKKRLIIGGMAVIIIGGVAWYLWNDYKKKKKAAAPALSVTSDKPVVTAPAPAQAPSKPATTLTTPPASHGGPAKPSKAPAVSPVDKPRTLSADALIQQKGEMAIYGKILVAKNNGAGIYDTTMAKVSVTNAGEKLGKAFKAVRTSAGNYIIKYQDNSGQYRQIASSSVNVI